MGWKASCSLLQCCMRASWAGMRRYVNHWKMINAFLWYRSTFNLRFHSFSSLEVNSLGGIPRGVFLITFRNRDQSWKPFLRWIKKRKTFLDANKPRHCLRIVTSSTVYVYIQVHIQTRTHKHIHRYIYTIYIKAQTNKGKEDRHFNAVTKRWHKQINTQTQGNQPQCIRKTDKHS